jgi:hypothetical protein
VLWQLHVAVYTAGTCQVSLVSVLTKSGSQGHARIHQGGADSIEGAGQQGPIILEHLHQWSSHMMEC